MSMKSKLKTRELAQMSLFVALIIVGAYIKIPTPICPLTLQFLFTTMAGIVLGGKKGACCVAVYVLLGLIGVPVFTSGGGITYVLQPTFGYFPGFIIGTFITGKIANEGTPTNFRLMTASLAGLAVVYTIGTLYCGAISRFWLGSSVDVSDLIRICILTPLPGDLIKCLAATVLAKKILPILKTA